MVSFNAVFCLNYALLVLAIFINAEETPDYHSTSRPNKRSTGFVTVPPDCIDKELCTKKPIDYPTEIINREARHLLKHSQKSHKAGLKIETKNRPRRNENCVEEREEIQPFLYATNDSQHIVIQSGFYKQTVVAVTCRSERKPCFQSLWDQLINSWFYCETQYSLFSLFMYNPTLNKTEVFEANIPVACSCMLEKFNNETNLILPDTSYSTVQIKDKK